MPRISCPCIFYNRLESGYQLVNSLIAYGGGGILGRGLGNSLQKEYFLPQAHTEFIFTVCNIIRTVIPKAKLRPKGWSHLSAILKPVCISHKNKADTNKIPQIPVSSAKPQKQVKNNQKIS